MKVPPLALSGLLGVINNLPCKDSIIFLFIYILNMLLQPITARDIKQRSNTCPFVVFQ